jgi:hypothetical protein
MVLTSMVVLFVSTLPKRRRLAAAVVDALAVVAAVHAVVAAVALAVVDVAAVVAVETVKAAGGNYPPIS